MLDRIALLDPGTFHELEEFWIHRATGFGVENHRLHTGGVVAGWGEIFGAAVFVAAADSRIYGGLLG